MFSLGKYRFTNYHQHDSYSFLDGFSTPHEVVARCKELGMKFCMETNHGNVAGHIDFYNECVRAGLIPLLGTELYLKDDTYDNGKPKGFHLLLWALNEEGVHNIWAISSASYLATTDKSRTNNATWKMLEGHGAGVVCSSACLASMLSDAARMDDVKEADYFCNRCIDIFDEFAIELHTNSIPEQRKVNLWLDKYAHSHNIKTVYSVDAHYARKEDAQFHDAWLGNSTSKRFDENHFKMDHEYYIQDAQEVVKRLDYLGEESIERCFSGVDELLSKVEPFKFDGSHKVAKFPLPDGFTNPNSYLLNLVSKGLLIKIGHLKIHDGDVPGEVIIDSSDEEIGKAGAALKPALDELSNKELPIIIDNGLADYFLMTWDECKFAKQHMMMGPGRGSAVGSLVCYLLDITTINPLGRGLIFERFLNQGRLGTWIIGSGNETLEFGEFVQVGVNGETVRLKDVSQGDHIDYIVTWQGKRAAAAIDVDSISFRGGELPDIDCDFEPDSRYLVPEHFSKVYGQSNVAAVGTISFYSIKSAISDVARYYRISFKDSKKITKIVGQLEEMAGEDESWEDEIPNLSTEERTLMQGYQRDYPDLFKTAMKFVNLARQPSKHAAGYVVSPIPLAKWLPVRKAFSQGKEEIIAQFDKYQIESLGFVKDDVLGLRNIETIHVANGMLGQPIDFYNLEDEASDSTTWDLFIQGRTLGIFQMKGDGITNVAKQLKPKSVDDLATILALYRPGVIGAGMLDEYIDRALGIKEVSFICPQLEHILKSTYGVIVYQEQAMQIFHDLGNFSDAEADRIRAAIGHKKIDQINACEQQFYDGCTTNGIALSAAHEIFEQIKASGSYSFNKSHSLAYGTIAYWTAYLKAHHPKEFYAASMSTVNAEDIPAYMVEAKRMGYPILPPVLSHLSRNYTVVGDDIVYGLYGMKGVGDKAIDKILAAMPYAGFDDFIARSGANKTVIGTLINAGVFREENPNRRELYLRFKNGDVGDTLFGDAFHEEHKPYTDEQVANLERDIFGMPLSVDKYSRYKKILGQQIVSGLVDVENALKMPDGAEAPMLITVEDVRQKMSKRGLMAFISATTSTDESIEFTVFSDIYELAHVWFVVGSVMLVGLVKGSYNGNVSWTMHHMKHFEGE